MTTRCRSSSRGREKAAAPLRHPEHVQTLAIGQTHFAWNLYKACRAQTQKSETSTGNLCFSPLILHHVLTMSYTGARYESAEMLRNALHLGDMENDAALNLAYADVTRSLTSTTVQGLASSPMVPPPNWNDDERRLPHRLHLATRMYVPITHCLLDQFITSLRLHYGSDVAKVPFHTDKERARREMNQWVEESTDQTIRELVRPLGLATFVSVVLASAVYFKPAWDKRFAGGRAKMAPFYNSPNDAVHVMTFRSRGSFRHGTIDDAQCRLAEIPFADDRFSLVLLLPNRVGNEALDEVEAKLTADILNNVDEYLQLRTKIKVVLPRFRVEDTISLGKVLMSETLGVAPVFARGKADLSGISGNNNLHLSHVEHKVCFELEHFRRTTAPKKDQQTIAIPPLDGGGDVAANKQEKSRLEFNRPFIYMVRDRYLNMFLLLGCVRKLSPPTPD